VNTVKLIGWTRGMQTVSLIKAICEYSGASLSDAKAKVESLLDDQPVTIEFPDAGRKEAFRNVATGLGARCE
jgi:hypothetical protein